jgi:hypothetical protein
MTLKVRQLLWGNRKREKRLISRICSSLDPQKLHHDSCLSNKKTLLNIEKDPD